MGGLVSSIAPQSVLSQSFPPKPHWTAADIPDLSGKVIIVTGGNTGVGYVTVKALLSRNAKVYLAARTPSKAEAAVERLRSETGREPVLLQLDLADLKSVRTAADEFLGKESELHVLFNNAGVMIPPTDQLTAQGYDLQFGTNVLGHWFFTTLLVPALERATASTGQKARVIHTSSSAHELTLPAGETGIDWDTLKDGPARDKKNLPTWTLYGQSKLGNVLTSNLFVRHHSDILVSAAVNPGNIKTDLQRYVPGWQQTILNLILYPAYYGAITQLWAGTAPEAEGCAGKYLIPWARVGKADKRAANTETQDKLEAWLKEQVKGF